MESKMKRRLNIIINGRKMGFIDGEQLKKIAQPLLKSGYGTHLLSLI